MPFCPYGGMVDAGALDAPGIPKPEPCESESRYGHHQCQVLALSFFASFSRWAAWAFARRPTVVSQPSGGFLRAFAPSASIACRTVARDTPKASAIS